MKRRIFSSLSILLGAGTCLAVACSSNNPQGAAGDDGGSDSSTDSGASSTDASYEQVPYDGTSITSSPRVPVYSEVLSDRVDVQQLLFAAGEMQISGEPFASGFAGRNLGDYDRNYIPPNQYILNNGGDDPIPITDLFGFGTAVESYEYSKYYMNMEIQESTAGVSLANGPIVATLPGAASLDRLRARMQDLLSNSGTDIGGYATLPAPVDNNQNYLGFPGQWPSFLPVHVPGWLRGPRLRDDDRSPLRVRLQHDAPHRPRHPGQQGARPRGARLRDVEGGDLGHRLRRARPRHVQ
jgi:hypothetical protein